MLRQVKKIYFISIKGVAMANLAVIFKKMGHKVTGADEEQIFITDKLLKLHNISLQIGFDPKKLPKDTDLVVYSAAHKGTDNPIVREAYKKKIKVISQTELLGELMKEFEIKIAVSGCHGKTTTSSFLAYALNKLNAFPSYFVGAPFFTGYQGGDYQGKKYFVCEADEYGVNPPIDRTPKFLNLNPDYIICTNIAYDHPDVYKDIKERIAAFTKFFGDKKLIVCADRDNLMGIVSKLNKNQYVSYGFSKKSDYEIINPVIDESGSSFEVKNLGKFKIDLFGKMNILNATAIIIMLHKLGFKVKDIASSIRGFIGSERRFEKIYFNNNIYLFDDYAHHPNEIEATIQAAKDRFKTRRIIVIFQPHTFSRTKTFLKEFSNTLSKADYALILPIFASARENKETFTITSSDIVKIGGHKNLIRFKNIYELLNHLECMIKSGDVIFTMGAGNVYKLKDELIKIIDEGSWNIDHKVDLYSHLTLKTHVIAECFLQAKTKDDLIKAKRLVLKNKKPLFLLGGGSNLAFISKNIKGLVVKNSYVHKEIINETKKYVDILVSSGYPVSLLINETIDMGLSGFEYHKGLPGTIGGAVFGNSKWTRPLIYITDNLLYADIIDDKGKIKRVKKDYFNFSYDYSILKKTNEILVDIVFRLKKEDKKILKQRADESLAYRIKTQPHGVASSGCFFKNIPLEEKITYDLPTTSAGYLIDKVGLKGHKVGGFYISNLHANFIINDGSGKSEDLIKLLDLIKTKVYKKFKIKLEEEVLII